MAALTPAQSAVSTGDALWPFHPSQACLVHSAPAHTRFSCPSLLVPTRRSRSDCLWLVLFCPPFRCHPLRAPASAPRLPLPALPGHTWLSYSAQTLFLECQVATPYETLPPECPPDSSNLMDSKKEFTCFQFTAPSPPTLPVRRKARAPFSKPRVLVLPAVHLSTHGPVGLRLPHLFTSQLFHSTSVLSLDSLSLARITPVTLDAMAHL